VDHPPIYIDLYGEDSITEIDAHLDIGFKDNNSHVLIFEFSATLKETFLAEKVPDSISDQGFCKLQRRIMCAPAVL
jgi:hypothetical protein